MISKNEWIRIHKDKSKIGELERYIDGMIIATGGSPDGDVTIARIPIEEIDDYLTIKTICDRYAGCWDNNIRAYLMSDESDNSVLIFFFTGPYEDNEAFKEAEDNLPLIYPETEESESLFNGCKELLSRIDDAMAVIKRYEKMYKNGERTEDDAMPDAMDACDEIISILGLDKEEAPVPAVSGHQKFDPSMFM